MSGWAVNPTDQLSAIREKVTAMQTALGTRDLATGTHSANELVSLTTRLIAELDLDRDHDHDRDAELLASLRVYRNAAFAFRKLADGGGDPEGALRSACRAMIEQGHDHLQAHMGQDPPPDEAR